ncbi:MAG: hypothetical protein QME76_03655 [Bacillota bacterium]|nr:hypothetical protein [Bacillota bacterium]
MGRGRRTPGGRRWFGRKVIPFWGIALTAAWGLLHLAQTGRMARLAAAGGAGLEDAVRSGWVPEGLFLLFIALAGLAFARPVALREPLAVRLYKVLALGLLALAAWHRLGPAPAGFPGRLYTPVLTLAAALILVPLYLPAPENLPGNARRKGRDGAPRRVGPGM